MKRFPSILAAASVVALLASQPNDAVADDSQAQAETHFTQGAAYFRVGEFALCAKEFAASYALSKKPNAVFNEARCLEEAGKLPEAARRFEFYVAFASGEPKVVEAKARLAALQTRIREAEDAKTTSDATEPAPASVESQAVTTAQPAPVAPSASPAPSPTAATLTAPERPSPWMTRRRGAYLSGGIAAVGLGLGTVFALKARGDWSDAEALCPSSPCSNEQGVALSNDARGAADIATFAFGGALVAGAIGGYLWFTHSPETSGPLSTAVVPSVRQHGFAVSLQGAY